MKTKVTDVDSISDYYNCEVDKVILTFKDELKEQVLKVGEMLEANPFIRAIELPGTLVGVETYNDEGDEIDFRIGSDHVRVSRLISDGELYITYTAVNKYDYSDGFEVNLSIDEI